MHLPLENFSPFCRKNRTENFNNIELLQIDKDDEGKENYCVAYECKNDGWEVGFEVCVCPKQDYVKNEMLKIKEEKAPTIDLCCPESYLTDYKFLDGQVLTCAYGSYTENRICESEVWELTQDPTNIWTSKKDDNVCIGYTMQEQAKSLADEFEKGILATQYTCKKLCEGKTPCIRYVMLVKSSECILNFFSSYEVSVNFFCFKTITAHL